MQPIFFAENGRIRPESGVLQAELLHCRAAASEEKNAKMMRSGSSLAFLIFNETIIL